MVAGAFCQIFTCLHEWYGPDCCNNIRNSKASTAQKRTVGTSAWLCWVLNFYQCSEGPFMSLTGDVLCGRVWSVAHSVQRRHLVASTSDDGTVRLWAGQGLRASAGVLRPAGGAPVCGAAFCSGDGNLLALAAADCRAYVYDLRATASPLAVLAAHTRPVSYARFLGRGEVVTASTDGSLALWDVAAAAAGGAPGARAGLSRTFRGHVNAKNFVGLAVCERERLLATGSETGAAVGYHTSWATPLAARAVVRARGPGAREFVSAIAWRPDSAGSRGPVLATALSNGDVRMLQLVAAA